MGPEPPLPTAHSQHLNPPTQPKHLPFGRADLHPRKIHLVSITSVYRRSKGKKKAVYQSMASVVPYYYSI